MADITIKKCNDFLVWKQAVGKLGKNMSVQVDDGLTAFAMVGGFNVGEFDSTAVKLLNQEGGLSKQYGKKCDAYFLVFDNVKTFDVHWGVGKEAATYADTRMRGMQLGVTAYGRCKVKVVNAAKLWAQMDEEYKRDGVIEPSEVETFIQRGLIAKVKTLLSEALGEVGDYTKMQAAAGKICDKISLNVELESYGLRVTDTIIEGIRYTDESMEKIRKNESVTAAQIDSDLVKEQAGQIRDILAAVSGKEEV